jgi:hypothetical protein
MDYNDVKTKTLNWCKKLYNNGTYNLQNYNDCISIFGQDTEGEIPNGLKVPRTGMEHAYGLYDRTPNYIEKNSPNSLNKKIFLTTFDGHHLACNQEGHFYLVKDFQNENINQNDLEWHIVSLGDNIISIMSSHMKYLTANADHCISNNGTEINAATKWKISRVDDSIYLKSVLFPKMNLTYVYDKTNKVNLKLRSGLMETGIWNFVDANPSVKRSDYINEYMGTELISEKRRQISKFIRGKKIKKLIDTEIYILRQLRHQIKSKLNTINQTIDTTYKNSVSTYRSLSGKYLDDLNKLDTYRRRLTIDNTPDAQFYMLNDSISKLENKLDLTDQMNMTQNMKNQLIDNITAYSVECVNHINSLINERQTYLDKQKLNSVDIELDEFINGLERDIDTINNQIKQNNSILTKQSKMISQNKEETSVKEDKIKKYQNDDDVLENNIDFMVKKRNTIGSYNKYKLIFLIILILLIIVLIYLTYVNIKTAYY